MELRLDFVGVDEARRSAFRLAARDGRYALPRLVLTASAQAWVKDTAIVSCEVSAGAEPLLQALLAGWAKSGPSGRGTRLSSEQCWLPAELVNQLAEVRATWAVTWSDTGLYQRYANSGKPFREENSVTLEFEPAPASGAPPAGQQGPAWHHRGHVAVDFGTSYCTATLFEQQYLPAPHPLSRNQAARLRADIIDLLDHGPESGPGARREFGEFAAEIAASALPDAAGGSDAELRAGLQRALAEDDDGEPRLLYSVLLELERRVSQCSEELRLALAAALNDAYSRAWKVPPLDRLRLFEVLLDVNEGAVVESKATATLEPQLTVRVGRGADDDEEGAPETHVYAGLKQRLSAAERHPELGAGVTSDHLIREALRDIIGRCNSFIAQGPRELGTGPINNVVITFPTMATPSVRRKLHDMLQATGISLVDNSFDEAIAAAMFTVLRDFGGDYDTGLELLRSQSQDLGNDKWKQNLLVIDIGGGTTDIALLGLNLHDKTPGGLGDAGAHGRYYELLPEVLGSTGRLQLGGELMSLRVFYWIKALLGDKLLPIFPDSFARSMADLRQIVRGEPGDNPLRRLTKGKLPTFRGTGSSGDAFDVLDRVVPTRSAAGYGRPGQAFWLLWRIADRVKLDFCALDAPQEISLRAAEVRRVLQVAEWPAAVTAAPDVPSIPDEALAITLAKTDFEGLVTGDVSQVMELAYRLTSERLRGSGALDRIVLTGQTSRAPMIRKQLVEVFDRHKNDAMAFSWRPSTVDVVQGEFAKLATSLGACWAKANIGQVPTPKGAIEGLAEGRNAFRISADNLFFNLPCTFLKGGQLGGQRDASEILQIGDEMFQAYPDQDLAIIRSKEFELTGIVAIFREAQGESPRWGDFQWELMESDQGLNLDRTIWPSEIVARLETTSNLDLFLLLSKGRAHYQVSGKAFSVLDAAAAAGEPMADGQAGPVFSPHRIVVNAFSGDGNHKGAAIFPQAGPGNETDALAGFPEIFHIQEPGEQEQVLHGAVSGPLPEPPVVGAWSFHYLDDEKGMHYIGEHQPPPRTGQLTIRYFASVDEQGNLRVHAGEVPYLQAASLAEVQERPGSVYRADMVSTFDDYEPGRDPYNGRH